MSRRLYAVIAEDGSGLHEGSIEFADTRDRAVALADTRNRDAESASVPVVNRVFVFAEVEDSAQWDWSVCQAGETPQYAYVSERAARNSLPPGWALMRRRLGTDRWEAVNTGE